MSMHHMICTVKHVHCTNRRIEEDLQLKFSRELLLCLLETKSKYHLPISGREKKSNSFLLIRYDKAVDMLKRQSVILQKFTSRSHLYKANLSILIVMFAMDDVAAGKQFSQMCGNDPGFAGSEEAEIAEDILRAYETVDQELLEKTVRLQHVTFLDNEVVKLARTLTVPGEILTNSSPTRNKQQQQYQRAPPVVNNNSDVRNMSHAQARSELYSRPSQPVDDVNNGFSKMKVQPDFDDEDDEGLR